MLNITRKAEPGENKILIGSNIIIVVKWISKDNVELGVVAPSHVKILRGEVVDGNR